MEFKIYSKQKLALSVALLNTSCYPIILIPYSFKKEYQNVKKKLSDKWVKGKNKKWYLELSFKWLFWEFTLFIWR